MKRTLFKALVATAALSSTAFADKDMSSQYFYQAPSMTHVLTPSLNYQMSQVKNKNYIDPTSLSIANTVGSSTGNPEANTSGMGLGIGYDYGIDEDMAVGVDLSIGGSTTETSPKDAAAALSHRGQGLSDIGLRFQDRVPMVGPGNLVWGARANLNIQKTQQGEVGGSRTANLGYNHITPYVGYEMMMGPGLLGLKLDYEVIRGNRKIAYTDRRGGAWEFSNKAGARWAWGLFYELPSDDWMVGAALDMVTVNDSKRSFTRTDKSNQVAYETQDPASTDMVFRLYSTWMLDKDITLLPSLSYTSLMSKYREGVDTEAATDLNFTVAGRFTF